MNGRPVWIGRRYQVEVSVVAVMDAFSPFR